MSEQATETPAKGHVHHDPATYAAMVEPRPREEAVAALDAFTNELSALRRKHRVCDMLYVAVVSTDDGGPPPAMVGAFGSHDNAVPMAASALKHFRSKCEVAGPLYEISTDSYSEAAAKLVEQFKAANYPGVGEFKITCHDGSTMHVKLKGKPVKASKAKGGEGL